MAKSRSLPCAPWYMTSTSELLNHLNTNIGSAVDDLSDVIDWLREEKEYEKADRIRTIAGRLARLQRPDTDKSSIRNIARGWE